MIIRKLSAYILLLMLTEPTWAKNQAVGPAQLPVSNSIIKTIARPIFNTSKSPTFNVAYKVGNPTSKGPTIIFFSGGPGIPIVDSLPTDFFFPAGSRFIIFDPRGTGHSEIPAPFNVNSKSSSSEQISEDVLAILQKENINSYVIWGHSYGTVPATIFTSKVSYDRATPKPIVVILEGTIGRSFRMESGNSIYEGEFGFKFVMSSAFNKIGQNDVNTLVKKVNDLKISPAMLFDIFSNVVYGGVGDVVKFIKEFNMELNDVTAEKLLKFSASQTAGKASISGVNGLNQMKAIGCNEIQDQNGATAENFEFSIAGLNFFDSSFLICKGITAINSYDSSRYQISKEIPVLYMASDDDPSTPSWQARYHFQNQKTLNNLSIVIETSSGGHFPFQANPLFNCRDNFWTNVFSSNVSAAISALSLCQTLE